MQGHDAFLDVGAPAVVYAHQGHPERSGQIDHLVDLLAGNLAQGPTVHREVLGEGTDPVAVHGAEARDHAVGVGALVLAGPFGAAAGQHVQLLERPRVEEIVEAFAGRHLAPGVLAFDGRLAAGVEGGLAAAFKFLETVRHRLLSHAAPP